MNGDVIMVPLAGVIFIGMIALVFAVMFGSLLGSEFWTFLAHRSQQKHDLRLRMLQLQEKRELWIQEESSAAERERVTR